MFWCFEHMDKHINIIIATTFYRNDLLINRSLKSVYEQIIDDKSKIKVIIVDDNEVSQIPILKEEIQYLRRKLKLGQDDFETFVISNTRRKHQSGTGAWNTGIFFIKTLGNWEESFIAILDDDDEWYPDYLKKCVSEIVENNQIIAVFSRIIWRNEEDNIVQELTYEKLTQRHFFIGNPGVQGSNIFIKTKILIEINGFNENYASTTDREIMIRFLDYIENQNKILENKLICKIVEEPLVIHYNHKGKKVNNDFIKKRQSLDLFYKEYKKRFLYEDFIKSLERAKKYFNYEYFGTRL